MVRVCGPLASFTKMRVFGESDRGPEALSTEGATGLRVEEQKGQVLELSVQGTGPRTRISANATTMPGNVTAVILERFK
jgi:hypothetical protein